MDHEQKTRIGQRTSNGPVRVKPSTSNNEGKIMKEHSTAGSEQPILDYRLCDRV